MVAIPMHMVSSAPSCIDSSNMPWTRLPTPTCLVFAINPEVSSTNPAAMIKSMSAGGCSSGAASATVHATKAHNTVVLA